MVSKALKLSYHVTTNLLLFFYVAKDSGTDISARPLPDVSPGCVARCPTFLRVKKARTMRHYSHAILNAISHQL